MPIGSSTKMNGTRKAGSAYFQLCKVVERDEPSHWMPYHEWLTENGKVTAKWRERMTDFWIHKSLMLVKLPALFINRTKRMTEWPDVQDVALA